MARIPIGRQVIDDMPDLRIYHVRTLMTEQPVELAYKFMPVENPILSALLDIPGVNMVELHPYHAVVNKAQQFEWSEIEPSIKRLFAALQLPLETVVRPDEF